MDVWFNETIDNYSVIMQTLQQKVSAHGKQREALGIRSVKCYSIRSLEKLSHVAALELTLLWQSVQAVLSTYSTAPTKYDLRN